MADIKTNRNHQLGESELRSQLEALAKEMEKKYGVCSEFKGNRIHLSGDALKSGEITWTADQLTVEVTLAFLGKMFKRQIEDEFDKRLDAITVA